MRRAPLAGPGRGAPPEAAPALEARAGVALPPDSGEAGPIVCLAWSRTPAGSLLAVHGGSPGPLTQQAEATLVCWDLASPRLPRRRWSAHAPARIAAAASGREGSAGDDLLVLAGDLGEMGVLTPWLRDPGVPASRTLDRPQAVSGQGTLPLHTGASCQPGPCTGVAMLPVPACGPQPEAAKQPPTAAAARPPIRWLSASLGGSLHFWEAAGDTGHGPPVLVASCTAAAPGANDAAPAVTAACALDADPAAECHRVLAGCLDGTLVLLQPPAEERVRLHGRKKGGGLGEGSERRKEPRPTAPVHVSCAAGW